ncbi:hypothetical protein [Montanilutibacter psychrotolerans]|uniref:Uncharacterized protein n=1 Tax=Montanilutibacter psychrotolerans TaxID=1327343 RepID=A0A3M8SUG1_9GAMM|nr:hypothetical protein [Lysobacter psychrotolerans]RNF82874.1 hypothetical protein EER27_13275 [Lysobacter psychrotolerans]
MRLTRIWFALSDAVARLLLAGAVLAAILTPVVGPMHAKMSHQVLSTGHLMTVSALWLAVAAGAFVLTRRRPLGLLPVALPGVALAVSGKAFAAACYLGLAALVFATPLVLAYFEARARAASGKG